MAKVYSYTFGSQLANQGNGPAIPITGTFNVDYDSLRVSSVQVTANNLNFTSGFINETSNSNGSIGYNVQLSYSPFSNDRNFLNFYLNSQQISTFTGVTYLRSFTDNSVFPSTTTFTQAQSAAVPVTTVAVCFASICLAM